MITECKPIETDGKGVPATQRIGRPMKWPFNMMQEVGQFFFVAADESPVHHMRTMCCRAAHRPENKGKRFAVIRRDQNGETFEKKGVAGYRVYRVA